MPRLTPPHWQGPLACPRASAWGPGQLALNQLEGRRDGRGIVGGAMAKSRQRRRSSCRVAALGNSEHHLSLATTVSKAQPMQAGSVTMRPHAVSLLRPTQTRSRACASPTGHTRLGQTRPQTKALTDESPNRNRRPKRTTPRGTRRTAGRRQSKIVRHPMWLSVCMCGCACMNVCARARVQERLLVRVCSRARARARAACVCAWVYVRTCECCEWATEAGRGARDYGPAP
jgi:hypothetical protein